MANLGYEIRATLYALYGKDEFHSKVVELEIFRPEDEQQRHLCAQFLELSANTQPAVCNIILIDLRKIESHTSFAVVRI